VPIVGTAVLRARFSTRSCRRYYATMGGGWRMRGENERSGSLFSYVDLEARVGQSHPLRATRKLVNEALAALASDFSAPYRDQHLGLTRSGVP
jgi:hypothetical protein